MTVSDLIVIDMELVAIYRNRIPARAVVVIFYRPMKEENHLRVCPTSTEEKEDILKFVWTSKY